MNERSARVFAPTAFAAADKRGAFNARNVHIQARGNEKTFYFANTETISLNGSPSGGGGYYTQMAKHVGLPKMCRSRR